MDPLGPNPLVRSFKRHLEAENRWARRPVHRGWDGHAAGGRPQLARKSEFGVFDTSVRSVPSGDQRTLPPGWVLAT